MKWSVHIPHIKTKWLNLTIYKVGLRTPPAIHWHILWLSPSFPVRVETCWFTWISNLFPWWGTKPSLCSWKQSFGMRHHGSEASFLPQEKWLHFRGLQRLFCFSDGDGCTHFAERLGGFNKVIHVRYIMHHVSDTITTLSPRFVPMSASH